MPSAEKADWHSFIIAKRANFNFEKVGITTAEKVNKNANGTLFIALWIIAFLMQQPILNLK